MKTIELEGFLDATHKSDDGFNVFLCVPVYQRVELRGHDAFGNIDLEAAIETWALELVETGKLSDQKEELGAGMLNTIFVRSRSQWRRGKLKCEKEAFLYFRILLEYTVDPAANFPYRVVTFECDLPLTAGSLVNALSEGVPA